MTDDSASQGERQIRKRGGGRLSIALMGAGPFTVFALQFWEKSAWIGALLLLLGAAGPVAYIASEAYLAARERQS